MDPTGNMLTLVGVKATITWWVDNDAVVGDSHSRLTDLFNKHTWGVFNDFIICTCSGLHKTSNIISNTQKVEFLLQMCAPHRRPNIEYGSLSSRLPWWWHKLSLPMPIKPYEINNRGCENFKAAGINIKTSPQHAHTHTPFLEESMAQTVPWYHS